MNAKMSYNFANLLRDQGRHSMAVSYYKTAIKWRIVIYLIHFHSFTVFNIYSKYNNFSGLKN